MGLCRRTGRAGGEGKAPKPPEQTTGRGSSWTGDQRQHVTGFSQPDKKVLLGPRCCSFGLVHLEFWEPQTLR
jgi:hypothetical protein